MKPHPGHVFLGVSTVVALVCVGCTGARPSPSGPATAPAIAYVAHSQSHSISVIKIPADQTVSTIQIGNSSVDTSTARATYPQNVVVSPDGTRAYVTDGVSSVWVVDTKSDSVAKTVLVGTSPEKMAISPDGKNLYVTSAYCGASPCTGFVNVIDTTTNTLKTAISISLSQPGDVLSGITVSPDGKHVYTAAALENSVWAIDTATSSVADTITITNTSVADIATSPDGSRVYAAGGVPGVYIGDSFVDVIDTQTDRMTDAIELGNEDTPKRIAVAVTPEGNRAFVTGESGHLWVVDTTANALFATFTLSLNNALDGIAITPDGTRIYVSCGNTNTIYVLGTNGSAVVDTILTDYPLGLTITPII